MCVCVCVCYTSLQVSPGSFSVWDHGPTPGGEGATKLHFPSVLSSAAGASLMAFPPQVIKSHWMVQSILCTPQLQEFIPAEIPLIVQVTSQKISQKSVLGSLASGLSFHLHRLHLLNLNFMGLIFTFNDVFF